MYISQIKIYLIKLIPPFLLIPFFQSCSLSPCGNSAEGLVTKVGKLVERVEADQKELSKSEWEDYDARFRLLADDCYDDFEAEMTPEQQKLFWKACFKYTKIRLKGSLRMIFSKKENTEMTEDLKKLIESASNKASDLNDHEIEILMKSIESDIKSWGKQLEDIFN